MSDQIKKAKAAGGIPAIVASVKALSAETGLVRGVRTLLQINQAGGVDCPGCAWPEPDQHRSTFEFCENGAKHVADEATTKRVTPEFFKQWSVAERAGTTHAPDVVPARCDSLRACKLGRRLRPARRRTQFTQLSRSGSLLYFGSREQRSCISLSTVRAPVWNQQPAGLFEHVSRVERIGVERDDRHREGNGDARRLRQSRRDLCHWAKSGHESSAHADVARTRETQGLQARAY